MYSHEKGVAMTKDQKVTYVQTQVNNARQQQFTREEFVSMFNGIWDGLEVARNAAIDPDPSPVVQP